MKRSRRWLSLAGSRRLIVSLTLVWLMLMLGWLAARSDGVGGRPLVIVWGADPGSYDPQQTSNPVAQDVFRHVCQPLFYEDEGGAVRGLLAEDGFQYSDDGRRLSIQLRPDITFHDGAALTAEVVQSRFERLQRLSVSPLLADLRGVAVTAQPDGRTVLFDLPSPDFDFVRLVLANPYAAIVSPLTQETNGPGFVACTGPYQFAASLYRPGHSLTLVRFADYRWPPALFANRSAPRIARIRFDFIADRAERLDALVDGQGCVLSLSAEDVKQVADIPRFRLYEATGGVTYLGFNFQRGRWQDVRARQAVAMALDKASLAGDGPFLVADTPLTPNTVGYDPSVAVAGYGYAPERSRKLLAEAGFDSDAEVVLLIPESSTYRQLAAAVQQQLQAIGLSQIRLREVARSDILTQRQDFDLLLFDYAWGDYTALGIFLGPGPRNLLNYSGGDAAHLVNQARLTADLNLRQQYVNEAQRAVLEQAVWQPLLVRQITFAVDGECVQGERQSPYGELLFYDADTAP